jgi:long-chain acyl-CoA synthetase
MGSAGRGYQRFDDRIDHSAQEGDVTMVQPTTDRSDAAVPSGDHATSWLWSRADDEDPKHVVRFAVDASGERWDGMTIGQLAQRVRSVAAGLVACGVEAGDAVAMMSPTRIDWTVTDLAVLSIGAVAVPIYDTSSVEQCRHILADSGAVLALGADAELAGRLREASGDQVREVLAFDDGALDTLAERGGGHEATVDERLAGITGDQLATLVYTSGTTGLPKGCRLTHSNIAWTVAQTRAALRDLLQPGHSTLLFLPLAHIFARVVQFVSLDAGVQLGYARSLQHMREDLLSFRPTFLLAVPRVFAKVLGGAEAKATGIKAPIFRFAGSTAEAWSTTERPGAGLKLQHRLADKLVYAKVREAVGGRVEYCLSGGAPLAMHLSHFFHAAGMTILEGYGLSETTAPVTVSTPDAVRFGTVGRPLPGVAVRLGGDGEVLVQGGNVFAGYHNRPDATDEVLRDGWFHTGDIGELDAEGFLRITDRKKEMIVTAAGKNVAPSGLEERLKSHPLVSQAMVVGDNRPFVGALITLDPEALEAQHLTPSGDPDADERLRAEAQKAVDHANESVSRAESIRRFVILPRDFTEADGEITPTLKLRRRQVADHFADAIEGLYADDRG